MNKNNTQLPGCEATKRGDIPPVPPTQFHEWRENVDPDSMGFDGLEGPTDET